MTPDVEVIAKLIGGGSAMGALLFILYRVGNRMVAAIDRVAAKVDDHTAADLASHAEMRGDLAEIRGEVRAALDLQERTPVGVEVPRRPRTDPRGVPIASGYYGPRPGTKGDGR